MLLCGVFRMFLGVCVVSAGQMRVVRRFLMITGFVMVRCLGVVVCSLRVVMSSLLVMMRCFL